MLRTQEFSQSDFTHDMRAVPIEAWRDETKNEDNKMQNVMFVCRVVIMFVRLVKNKNILPRLGKILPTMNPATAASPTTAEAPCALEARIKNFME